MFHTVTVNPSIDYVVSVDSFVMGQTNRSHSEKIYPGGKGINVAIMLGNLGAEAKAYAFVAGFTGKEIEKALNSRGINTDFIHLSSGLSRINVKLRTASNETEINGAGPAIGEGDINALLERLDAIKAGDTLVLSGNIPSALPKSLYSDIMEQFSGRGVRCVVDATGELLRKSLVHEPFLVKPNTAELSELYGVTLKTKEDVIPYAKRLRDEGAQNVLVSMGKYGAVLAGDDGKVYHAPPPDGVVVNTVGSGDSMVAGFLAGYDGTLPHTKGGCADALLVSLCAGSASAFDQWLASGEAVQLLLCNSYVAAQALKR